jgi:hypothetical protein
MPQVKTSTGEPTLRLSCHRFLRLNSTPGHVRSLSKAAEDLRDAVLDKLDECDKHNVRLVLGFDEASEMAIAPPGVPWNAYSQIRRVLRALRDYPIYSAFMSTTGSVRQFHPRQYRDNSGRIQTGSLRLWPPFTLVGFDQLAKTLKNPATLADVTKLQFVLGLGRPL